MGLAVDSADNLYVADAFRTAKFNSAGVFQSQTNIAYSNFYPVGVAVDAAGNVYSAETDQRTILGRLEKFGSAGTLLLPASLHGHPLGIALNSSGTILVSNSQGTSLVPYS